MYTKNGTFIGLETSAWVPVFPILLFRITIATNQIIYKNLNGYAVTKGVSTNVDLSAMV
jgi:outer membrane receptor for ferrienterochelin and colicins